jgi:hypothetical protein
MPMKYDWSVIEIQYVKGLEDEEGKLFWPTPQELADLHHCNVEYMRDKINKGNWKEKKRAYLLRLEMNENEIDIEDPKKELEKFNNKCYQASTNALDLVYRKIQSQSKAPDIHELTALIKVLERIQTIGQQSLNVQSDEFEKEKGQFAKLMELLKADEKAAKEAAKITSSEVETIDLRP